MSHPELGRQVEIGMIAREDMVVERFDRLTTDLEYSGQAAYFGVAFVDLDSISCLAEA
jgi:hypothetical protein